MQLLSTETHFYLRHEQHVIALSREDSSLKYLTASAEPLKKAVLKDNYVFFMGAIRIFGYNFLIVCSPAAPAVNFVDATIGKDSARDSNDGSNSAPSYHPLLDGEPFYHPLRLDTLVLLHADNVDKYVHLLLQKAVADMSQYCYINPSKRFAPSDPYCWNRHLFPVNITADDHVSKLRLENIIQDCMAYVFSGFYEQWRIGPESYVAIMMDRCIDNSGCRYFNRGISSSGATANTARVQLYYNNVLVYTLFRGSLPITFAQPPTVKYTPLIVLPDVHNDTHVARFNDLFYRHIDLLFSCNPPASTNIILVNLLKNNDDLLFDQPIPTGVEHGTSLANERALTETFMQFLSKSKALRSKSKSTTSVQLLNYNMHKHTFAEHNKLGEDVIRKTVKVSEVSNLKGVQPANKYLQVGYPRINCLDCVDRTTLFQTILLIDALKTYAEVTDIVLPRSFEIAIKSMSFFCGSVCSFSYMSAPPQRRMSNLRGSDSAIMRQIDCFFDLCNSLYRYIANRYTQQITVYNMSIFRNQSVAYHIDPLACLNLPLILITSVWGTIVCDVLLRLYKKPVVVVARYCCVGMFVVTIIAILCCVKPKERPQADKN